MSVLYLDASALFKLVWRETETAALTNALADGGPLASSEIALAELPRAIRSRPEPLSPDQRASLLDAAGELLGRAVLLRLGRTELTGAGAVDAPRLRTLDAIHLTTALSLGSALERFISYDRRQLEAARAAGLPVLSPA